MNKILFIDDEEDILNSYGIIFERSSKANDLKGLANSFLGESFDDDTNSDGLEFSVLTASQGLEGVSIIEEHLKTDNHVKIAFIDMRMPPGIDGLETAKRIRKLDEKIEIVIVTAYSDVDFKEVVKEVGSPDKLLYLKKPFDSQEIKQFALNLAVKYKNECIKDDFISSVSHELKTPLASILGFHQLLSDVENMPEEAQEYLSLLGYSAKLMQALIDELLMSLEIKRSGITLERKPIRVADFLDSCFKTLKPLIDEKEGVDFKLQLPPSFENETLFIDRTRVNQCINNLVNNALKFTSKGEINLKLEKENEKVIITVSDTGMGIPKEKLSFIFEKFSRVEDKHHEVPGLGLGLNIVKNIMDAHKAQIRVSSIEGQGTDFQLIFEQGENL